MIEIELQRLAHGEGLPQPTYATDGATNATLPKGADPKTLSLEEAVRLIDERAAKGPAKKKGGRKPAGKKAK